jgi:hypothetical protein
MARLTFVLGVCGVADQIVELATADTPAQWLNLPDCHNLYLEHITTSTRKSKNLLHGDASSNFEFSGISVPP